MQRHSTDLTHAAQLHAEVVGDTLSYVLGPSLIPLPLHVFALGAAQLLSADEACQDNPQQ